MCIIMIVLGAVGLIYLYVGRGAEHPRASMTMQENVMNLARQLQADLLETNTQTIRSFPNPVHPGEPPGMSLESPRMLGGSGDLQIGPIGTVNWSKYVYYTLQPSGQPGIGLIVRREDAVGTHAQPSNDTGLPLGSDLLPSAVSPTYSKLVARDIVLPNTKLSDGTSTDMYGGFKVYFEQISTVDNTTLIPTMFDEYNRNEPVIVDLIAREVSPSTGQDSIMRYELKLLPRN